jgi:hypothetical protein
MEGALEVRHGTNSIGKWEKIGWLITYASRLLFPRPLDGLPGLSYIEVLFHSTFNKHRYEVLEAGVKFIISYSFA